MSTTTEGLKKLVSILYEAELGTGKIILGHELSSPVECIERLCGKIDWCSNSTERTLKRWRLRYSKSRHQLLGVSIKQDAISTVVKVETVNLNDNIPVQISHDLPPLPPPIPDIELEDSPIDLNEMPEDYYISLAETSDGSVIYQTVDTTCECDSANPSSGFEMTFDTTPPTIRRKIKKNVINSAELSDSDELEAYGYSDYLIAAQIEPTKVEGIVFWPLVKAVSFLTTSPCTKNYDAARRIIKNYLPKQCKRRKLNRAYAVDTTMLIKIKNHLNKYKLLDKHAWLEFCKYHALVRYEK